MLTAARGLARKEKIIGMLPTEPKMSLSRAVGAPSIHRDSWLEGRPIEVKGLLL